MQAETAVSLHFEAIRDKVRPSEWRVEAINSKTGDVFVAIFYGPLAQARATEYAHFKNGHSERIGNLNLHAVHQGNLASSHNDH